MNCPECGHVIEWHNSNDVCFGCDDVRRACIWTPAEIKLYYAKQDLATTQANYAAALDTLRDVTAEVARLRAECAAAENFVNYLQEFLAFDAAWGDSEGHHWTKYQQARAARLATKE